MKVSTSVGVSTLLLFIHVSLATHYKASYREEIIVKTDFIKEGNFIKCTCHGQNKIIDIRKKDRQRVYEKLHHSGLCELKGKKKTCWMYRNCHNCSFHMVDCQPNAIIHNKYDCQKKSFMIHEKSISHVIKDSRASQRRYKRDALCPLPKNGSTYDVICRNHSSYIKCQQRCILGYTLKNGISGKRRCFYNENTWKPRGFKECQPFIDCEMTLIKPGFLECKTASTTSFPTCKVKCEAFEGQSATPMEKFECRITGAWIPSEIPFCVTPKAGKELVPPPKIDFYSFRDDFLRFEEADELKSGTE